MAPPNPRPTAVQLPRRPQLTPNRRSSSPEGRSHAPASRSRVSVAIKKVPAGGQIEVHWWPARSPDASLTDPPSVSTKARDGSTEAPEVAAPDAAETGDEHSSSSQIRTGTAAAADTYSRTARRGGRGRPAGCSGGAVGVGEFCSGGPGRVW